MPKNNNNNIHQPSSTRASSVASLSTNATSTIGPLDNPRRAMQRIKEEQKRSSGSRQNSTSTSLARPRNDNNVMSNNSTSSAYLTLQHLEQHNKKSSNSSTNAHNTFATPAAPISHQQQKAGKKAPSVAEAGKQQHQTQQNNNNTSFRRKSFGALHLQSHLHKWMTDATSILESWTSLGLLISRSCYYLSDFSVLRSPHQVSSSAGSNNNSNKIDEQKFLEFVVNSIDKFSVTSIAKTIVDDACQVWRDARKRVATATASSDDAEKDPDSFFKLALKVCSKDFLTNQEQELLNKCAKVFDLSVPVAFPSDFSCTSGVEKAVKIVNEIEKLIDASAVVLRASKKLQKAALSSLNENTNNLINKKSSKKPKTASSSSNRISTSLLSLVSCDEVQTLSATTSSSGNNNNSNSLMKKDSSASATATSSTSAAENPASFFYLLQYSSFKGAGVRFISGSALHRRDLSSSSSERSEVLSYLVQKVDMDEGLPLYMRAARASASSNKNLPESNEDAETDQQQQNSILNNDDDEENGSNGLLREELYAKRKSIRSTFKSGATLGFLPDITDLPSNEFAIQVHTSEQLSKEVNEICKQYISFEMFVGQPHEVLLAVVMMKNKNDKNNNSQQQKSHSDYFGSVLPCRISLSEPRQFFDSSVDVSSLKINNHSGASLRVKKEEIMDHQKVLDMNSNILEVKKEEEESTTNTNSSSSRISGGRLNLKLSMMKKSEESSSNTNNNNESMMMISPSKQMQNQIQQQQPKIAKQITRGEAAIFEMYHHSKASEHKGKCYGVIVGSCKESNHQFVAGIVELKLSLPSV